MTANSLPPISIVVIGHNEQKNLEQCLIALNHLDYPRKLLEVIYVDSKSTDNSIRIAERYTDKLFALRNNWPTAGEAFNKGVVESSHDYVHITAGDIIMDKDYLAIAIRTLQERQDIVAVTGYFEELNNTGWNRILGFRRLDDVDKSDHYVPTPNGGTFRKSALIAVNGYDERIKKGQEMELGIRFKTRGFHILYKHIPQGKHDFDIGSYFDLVKRFYNNGKSSAFMLLLSLRERDNSGIKGFRRGGIKTLGIFGGISLLVIAFLLISRPIYALAIVLLHAAYLISTILYKNRKRDFNYSLYAMNSAFNGFSTFCGMLSFLCKYCLLRLRGIDIIQPRLGLKQHMPSSINAAPVVK